MESNNVLISTTENIVGYEIVENLGEIFGVTTRSRNVFSDMGQNLKAVIGGELRGFTKLQISARMQAEERLREEAERVGANAVVQMRFDSNVFASVNEVTAYGTAVKIVKKK